MDKITILKGKQRNFKPNKVEKLIDVEYDVGNLLVFDKNQLELDRLKHSTNNYLLNLTRDNLQLLLNQVCELPTEKCNDDIVAQLPKPTYILPTQKRIPQPRAFTNWEKYAKAKGIVKKKKTKINRNQELYQSAPVYGFKTLHKKEWVLQIPKISYPLEEQFSKNADAKLQKIAEKERVAKKERVGKAKKVAKNKLQTIRNIAKAQKISQVSHTNSDIVHSNDHQADLIVANSSTASTDKLQNKLVSEEKARDASPVASLKRKASRDSQENSDNSLSNKKPKLDFEKPMVVHNNEEFVQLSEEVSNEDVHSKRKSNEILKEGCGHRKFGKNIIKPKRR